MRSIKRRCPGAHSPYSQEATLKSQYSTSNDARKPRGWDCCVCSFWSGRIGIGQLSPRTIFQSNKQYSANSCRSVCMIYAVLPLSIPGSSICHHGSDTRRFSRNSGGSISQLCSIGTVGITLVLLWPVCSNNWYIDVPLFRV